MTIYYCDKLDCKSSQLCLKIKNNNLGFFMLEFLLPYKILKYILTSTFSTLRQTIINNNRYALYLTTVINKGKENEEQLNKH